MMEMTTVWPSLIAVLGTLAGAMTTGLLQARVGRAQRREVLAETRRAELLAVVSELVSALANHRRAMWVRENHRLTGSTDAVVATSREISHETRAAVTAPLVKLGVLAPSLRDVAKDAERATYALRNAPDLETLAERRELAVQASDRLVAEAGAAFARQ
jgi:hypothetical protein